MNELLLIIVVTAALLLAVAAVIGRAAVRSGESDANAQGEPGSGMRLPKAEFESEFGQLHEQESFDPVPVHPVVHEPTLPEHYDADRLVLMVRDPYWLFCYWELTARTEIRAEALIGAEEYGAAASILRLIDLDTGEHWDVTAGYNAPGWYWNPARPGDAFVCELARIDRHGRYIALLRSNVVRTPRDGPSELTDPDWACPEDLWARLYPWGYRRHLGQSSPGWGFAPVGGSPGQSLSPWERSG